MYLNKEQLKKLLDNRPKGTTEQQVVESLISKGHTFDGIDLVPVNVRSQLEPKPQDNSVKPNGIANFLGETTGLSGTVKAIGSAILQNVPGQQIVNITQKTSDLIAQAKKFPIGSSERTRLMNQAQTLANKGATGAENVLNNIPTTKQAIGSMGKLALTAVSAGVGAPATVAGRIGLGAAIGAGFGASNAAEQNKSTGNIIGEGLIGGAIGAAVPAVAEGIKWAVKGIPKFLSYTSNTPEEVLQRQYDNPKLAKSMLTEVKRIGPTGVLEDIQSGSRVLRKNLTQQWDEGAQAVIDNNVGARTSFTQKELTTLQTVADKFGFDLPQNPTQVSINELLNLNRDINAEFTKKAIKEGVEGTIVRKAKEIVGRKLPNFIGAEELLSNYSGEKQVLDAISEIVKPYNNLPKSKTAALAAVKSIFNDNKPAFLSAVKDLEDATGIPFLSDKASALNILQKLPITSRNIFSQLGELLLSPITSPRAAGAISRIAGKVAQSSASVLGRSAVSEGIRKLLR